MSDNLLTVLVVEPGKPPYPRQIQDTLHAMQEIIGGDIEATYPYETFVSLTPEQLRKYESLYSREMLFPLPKKKERKNEHER